MRPPQSWQRAKVTIAAAGVAVLVWALVSALNLLDDAAIWGGFIPIRVSDVVDDTGLAPVILTPLTATFIHAGFVHLAFNLVVLLFCGRAVENILGPGAMLVLYLVGAYAAAGAQYLVTPNSFAPMVGASGAISAVLGAYALLFGRNKVRVEHPTLALWLNALWLAAAFIILQLLIGLTFEGGGMRLAIAAHIGGFLAGLILAKPLLRFRYRNA